MLSLYKKSSKESVNYIGSGPNGSVLDIRSVSERLWFFVSNWKYFICRFLDEDFTLIKEILGTGKHFSFFKIFNLLYWIIKYQISLNRYRGWYQISKNVSNYKDIRTPSFDFMYRRFKFIILMRCVNKYKRYSGTSLIFAEALFLDYLKYELQLLDH